MPSDQEKKDDDSLDAAKNPPADAPSDSLDGQQSTPAAPPASSAGTPATPGGTTPPGAAQESTVPNKKPGLLQRFSLFNNMYLVVFVLLVLAASAVVYVSMKIAKPTTTTNKVGSLTDQQLSSIKGNTTLVGDSKQTLDIQSNSIFEGQVLARSDFNVAGSLKVGGSLSLPSISVGGSGTFGQLGVNGGLNIGGDTTLQGQLTVQKNLSVAGSASFGSLSVSSLSVTSLALRGDINLNQHIVTSGGVPGHSNGSALGGGGTASVSGSDTSGTVAINTGSGPPAGCFVTISFAHSFGATPHIVVSPSNSSAGAIQFYTSNRSASGFSICANNPAAGTNYIFDYIVIQ